MIKKGPDPFSLNQTVENSNYEHYSTFVAASNGEKLNLKIECNCTLEFVFAMGDYFSRSGPNPVKEVGRDIHVHVNTQSADIAES